jgi:hypothetical protein
MTQPQTTDTPHFVVLTPGSDQGRRIDLTKDHVVVGRAATCDVRLDDPHVSRTHAALQRRGGAVYVQDLGSSAGTFVNEGTVSTPRQLHLGDVVAFAAVRLRYGGGESVGDETSALARPTGPSARYDIGEQHGGAINNVAHDQHISYVQHMTQQRENFFREIAATRTKARWLVWTGFLLFVVGFGLFAAGIMGFIKQTGDIGNGGDVGGLPTPFGRDVAGIPSGLLGWALAALGVLLLVVGIVLHVVATSRRKRVDRDLPVPPPWQAPGQWGG